MKLTKKQATVIAIFFLIIAAAAYHQFVSKGDSPELAQCLSDKGIKMYGAYWCHNCVDQKEMFGESARFLDYIECTEEKNKEVCDAEEIQYFPTWKFPNGQILIGKQSFDVLRKESGC